jgi:hypothetical protein
VPFRTIATVLALALGLPRFLVAEGHQHTVPGFRLNFIYRPGSDIDVVYNDLQQTGLPTDVFKPSDRQIVVKLNYLLAR